MILCMVGYIKLCVLFYKDISFEAAVTSEISYLMDEIFEICLVLTVYILFKNIEYAI